MFVTIDIKLLVSNPFSVHSHASATFYSPDHNFIFVLISYYFSLSQTTNKASSQQNKSLFLKPS